MRSDQLGPKLSRVSSSRARRLAVVGIKVGDESAKANLDPTIAARSPCGIDRRRWDDFFPKLHCDNDPETKKPPDPQRPGGSR